MSFPDIMLQSIINGMMLGGIYALYGVGASLIWGVMKVGNFAHGAVAFLGTYFFYSLLVSFNVHPLLAMLLPLPVFFLIGMIIFETIIYPSYTRIKAIDFEMGTMLVTFGLALVIESLISYIWGTDIIMIPSESISPLWGGESIRMGALFLSGQGMIALSVAIVTVILLEVFLRRTYLGIAIRAVSQNREVAATLGVKIRSIWLLSFGLTTILACAAGETMGLLHAFYPQGDLIWCIKAFIVVTLGGLGSVAGTLAGGLMLGLSESLATSLLPSVLGAGMLSVVFRDVVALGLFFVLLIVRPQGLFGKG
jgi:branched-chain amino acid transport system permease protein